MHGFIHMDLFLTRRDSPIANDCRPINSDSQACSNNYFVLFLFLPVAKCRPQVLAFSCAVQFGGHTWSCSADTWRTRFFHLLSLAARAQLVNTVSPRNTVILSSCGLSNSQEIAVRMSIAVFTISGQRAVFCKLFHYNQYVCSPPTYA